MKGKKRCRLHGGKSPGAPKGRANGNYRTGIHTQEHRAMVTFVNNLTGYANVLDGLTDG